VDAVVSTDGTAADLAIGVAWDMAVHKQSPSEALFGNLISFGIGFGIGRGISGIGRLAGRNADNVNVRGGNTRIENTNQNIGAGSRNWKLDDAQPTDKIPNQAHINSCASACSVVLLRDQGIHLLEEDVMKYVDTDGSDMVTFRRLQNPLNKIMDDLLPNSSISFVRGAFDDLRQISYFTDNNRHVMANLQQHAIIIENIDFERGIITILDPWGNGYGTGIAFEGTLSFEKFNELHRRSGSEILVPLDGSKIK